MSKFAIFVKRYFYLSGISVYKLLQIILHNLDIICLNVLAINIEWNFYFWL